MGDGGNDSGGEGRGREKRIGSKEDDDNVLTRQENEEKQKDSGGINSSSVVIGVGTRGLDSSLAQGQVVEGAHRGTLPHTVEAAEDESRDLESNFF